MVSGDILDIEELLRPIMPEKPGGVELDQSDPRSPYSQLKDAREKAVQAERLEDSRQEPDSPSETQWKIVLKLAPEVIRAQSKDLQVAVWLIEALVRIHGFAGLRKGFELARGLSERFWDDLYPRGEEEVADKLGPITGVNASNSFIPAIRKVPITDTENAFAAWEYLSAAASDDRSLYDELERSAKGTSQAFFWSLIRDLEQCQREWDRLSEVLREKAGAGAVFTSRISQVLEEVADAVARVAKDIAGKQLPPPPEDQQADPAPRDHLADDSAQTQDTDPKQKHGKLHAGRGATLSREDAFKQLLEIASFFEATEPHSPISHTLREVVRRGRLPLVELLEELIPDEEPRTKFLERAGIKPPASES